MHENEDLMRNIVKLASELGECLKEKGETLTTAESCTGGGIAYMLTEVSGSSAWFNRAYITYCNDAKEEMLLVSKESLRLYGAVSEDVVFEMAKGALKGAKAHFAVAVSGIAGPSGGTQTKPVGTVCFAWASKEGIEMQTKHFQGDRHKIRMDTIEHALSHLLSRVKNKKTDV